MFKKSPIILKPDDGMASHGILVMEKIDIDKIITHISNSKIIRMDNI